MDWSVFVRRKICCDKFRRQQGDMTAWAQLEEERGVICDQRTCDNGSTPGEAIEEGLGRGGGDALAVFVPEPLAEVSTSAFSLFVEFVPVSFRLSLAGAFFSCTVALAKVELGFWEAVFCGTVSMLESLG